jgi:transposase InsO family protein
MSTPPGRSRLPAAGSASPSPWAGSGLRLDNAVIESWHSTLEFELRSVEHFATKAAARAKVAAWIEDYNTCRQHSACQMMSPVDYEKTLAA